MKAVFHVHTTSSPDGAISPAGAVRWCARNGVDCVFITDHDAIRGALAARDAARAERLPVTVVPGVEYKTPRGDLVAVFVEEMEEDFNEEPGLLIEKIHARGGLAVLPHPFSAHDLADRSWIAACDFIEVANGRTSAGQDRMAALLAGELGLKPIAGADAHLPWELGNAVLEFESLDAFRRGELTWNCGKTGRGNIIASQLWKAVRAFAGMRHVPEAGAKGTAK